jgi:DNA-binding MarR family transcriptional regulator
MSRVLAREAARDILAIVPRVMRTVAAELRSSGELPAPVHFGLLTFLVEQPRTLTELAGLQGVSLPTISNSVTALVQRGWVRRTAARDRRRVIVEPTAAGRAALQRVGRAAEAHLAERLAPLDRSSHRRLKAGLAVLHQLFGGRAAPAASRRRRRSSHARHAAV